MTVVPKGMDESTGDSGDYVQATSMKDNDAKEAEIAEKERSVKWDFMNRHLPAPRVARVRWTPPISSVRGLRLQRGSAPPGACGLPGKLPRLRRAGGCLPVPNLGHWTPLSRGRSFIGATGN